MDLSENMKVEQRKAPRFTFKEPVEYHLPKSNRFGGCLALDISESGMRFYFNDFIPVNSEIAFQFNLATQPEVVELKGRVVWTQRVPFSDRYQVGLQFEGHNAYPEIRERLYRYLRSH